MCRFRLLLVACLLCVSTTAPAATPRETALQVADTIEREFFDPQRAASMAQALRADAAGGRFDQYRNPQDLATALTRRLKAEDGHFNVRWSDAPVPPRAAQGLVDDPARSNFGIRRAELLPGNIGYLDLRYFADFEDAQDPARQAIDTALQFLGHADALVIDLRHNGGGSPAMVGYLASAFVAPGADIYNTFHSRRGTISEAPEVPHPAPRLDLPLYLLVSARTGSAAEAFAYTLKNARRATVVGEPSTGAANPGRPFELAGGYSVFVSTGSPLSPVTGSNWEGDGVQPDEAVGWADALRRAQQLALATLVDRGAGNDARWSLEALTANAAMPAADDLAALTGQYGVLEIEAVADGLLLRQGRRPTWRLQPLGGGLYGFVDEPTRRVRFEREPSGAVSALELLWADGNVARHLRGPAEP